MSNTITNPIVSAFYRNLQRLRDKSITEGCRAEERDQEGYDMLDSLLRHVLKGDITPGDAEEIRSSIEDFVVYNN